MAVRIAVGHGATIRGAATRPNVGEREKGRRRERMERKREREEPGAGVASRTDESARLLVVF